MSPSSRRLAIVLSLLSGVLAVGAAGSAEPFAAKKLRHDRYGDPLPPQAIARLGTQRFRGAYGCLAFSPDGKLLAAATGESGEQVTLWETATGRTVQRLTLPSTVQRVVFSPDGKRLACSEELHCHILNTVDGKEVFQVSGTYGVFAGDKKLITADVHVPNQRLRVWDAATGKALPLECPGRFEGVNAATDGRIAVAWNRTRDNGAEIQFVDVDKCQLLRKHSFRDQQDVALSPDGKTLATAGDSRVQLWDTAGGKAGRSWECCVRGRPVFSADGKQLAWDGPEPMGRENYLWGLDLDSDKPRKIGPAINCMDAPCFSPDDKLLAVVTEDYVVSLRNLRDGKESGPSEAHTSPIFDVAFSADGRRVASRDAYGDELLVWETRSGKLRRRLPISPLGQQMTSPFLANGFVLMAEQSEDSRKGTFGLRDAWTGENVLRFKGRTENAWSDGLSAGRRFIAVQDDHGKIAVLDVQTHGWVYRCDPGGAVEGLRLSANGETLFWWSAASPLQLHVHHRTAKKTLRLRNVPQDQRSVEALTEIPCLSPDGRWLVLPAEKGRLRRWDLRTGKEAPPLTEALLNFRCFVWSPDGRFMAGQVSPSSPAVDGAPLERRVWDATTGTRLRHLTLPDNGGVRVLFSHDGHTMLTTDPQGIIHLWEVSTGQERGRLRGHLLWDIIALALSSDDRMLVSGGNDTQGFVWDLTGRMPDGQWRQTTNTPEQRRTAWEALASHDAAAAHRAVWQLAADPEGTVAFLRERLRPVTSPDAKQLARLLAALDSPEFAERERASEELAKCGDTIVADLRQQLTRKPSLELRRRIEALLEKAEGVPHGRTLQALRGVEVLQHLNTPQARALLRELSKGAAGARLTVESQHAFQWCSTRAARNE